MIAANTPNRSPRLPAEIQHMIITNILNDAYHEQSPNYLLTIRDLLPTNRSYVSVISSVVNAQQQHAEAAFETAVANLSPNTSSDNGFNNGLNNGLINPTLFNTPSHYSFLASVWLGPPPAGPPVTPIPMSRFAKRLARLIDGKGTSDQREELTKSKKWMFVVDRAKEFWTARRSFGRRGCRDGEGTDGLMSR